MKLALEFAGRRVLRPLPGRCVAVALLAAVMTIACTRPHGEAQAAAPRAPVVVAIVIDQFAAWVASERLGLLPESGGFARLRREGTYVRAIRYEHAAAETAPGHAALFTGAPPSRSGVIANEQWINGRADSAMVDTTTQLVLPEGVSTRAGASPHLLRVDGVADVLREAHPDAVIIGLSLKDRGAILPSGRHADVAIWHDMDTNELATSTYYAKALPAWAAKVSASIPGRLREPWTLLDAGWVAAHTVVPDDQPGEEPTMRTFPHDLARQAPLGSAVRLSPSSNDTLVDLALAALDAEHRPGQPTFVTMSFSTNDAVGHAFGPDSWESWDQLLRLDGSLARLLEGLDRRFGKDGYAVALSADHGVGSIPEVTARRPECLTATADRWERPCKDASRFSRSRLVKELAAKAHATLGDGQWLYGFTGAFVALTPEGRRRRDTLVPALVATLEAHPEVAHAIDVKTLPAQCPDGAHALAALACHAYAPGSSGDILVVLRPGAGFGETSGASHGMPYTYDLTVPFLVRAPGQVRGGRVVDDELPLASFTRTLAKLLGVAPPPAASQGTVVD